MAPREAENNAQAKFGVGDKQRVLWYDMVFSGVFNLFIVELKNCTW